MFNEICFYLINKESDDEDLWCSLLAIGSIEEKRIRGFWSDEGSEVKFVDKKGKEHGFKIAYAFNRRLSSTIFLKNGLRHGKEIDYYPATFNHNAMQITGYCPENVKKRETYWKNGRKHGKETTWSKSGDKTSEIYWKDDKKEGKETIWQNGIKTTEIYRKNGRKRGTQTFFPGYWGSFYHDYWENGEMII